MFVKGSEVSRKKDEQLSTCSSFYFFSTEIFGLNCGALKVPPSLKPIKAVLHVHTLFLINFYKIYKIYFFLHFSGRRMVLSDSESERFITI